MIALYAALLIAYKSHFHHVFSKPIEVRWQVRWAPPLATETHSRRFKTADAAIEFASYAPMCEEKKEVPCVEWIRIRLVEVEPWVMEARR